MTAALSDPSDPAQQLLVSSMARRRRVRNQLATAWLVGSVGLALVPLGWVMVTVVQNGWAQFGWQFLTADIPITRTKIGPGMGPAVAGTLLITAAAAALAIPLGILAAVYLNEYGRTNRLASVIRFMSNVMTGVPSIVMGLFIAVVYVLREGVGYNGFAGSLALACLMLPIVIRSTEEMLKLVPDELRQASYALGNRKWRTTLTVVLPSAIGGITSGAMLAVARAAGETAPLIVTIAVVNKTNANIFKGANTALAPQIFKGALDPNTGVQQRAWGAALTLILLVFLFTVLARWISSRFALRHS
jgi:phosphate transport system permease protein